MRINEGSRVARESSTGCEGFLADCVENENPFDSFEMGPKVSSVELRFCVDAN